MLEVLSDLSFGQMFLDVSSNNNWRKYENDKKACTIYDVYNSGVAEIVADTYFVGTVTYASSAY